MPDAGGAVAVDSRRANTEEERAKSHSEETRAAASSVPSQSAGISRITHRLSAAIFGEDGSILAGRSNSNSSGPKSSSATTRKPAKAQTSVGKLSEPLGSAPKTRSKPKLDNDDKMLRPASHLSPRSRKKAAVICTFLEAAKAGRHERCAQMINSGACSRDVIDVESGRSAIHFAAKHGRVATLEVLLDMQLDDELQDKQGCTALHLAAAADQSQVIELLVDIGSDVDVRAGSVRKEWSPLMFAAANGSVGAIGVLLHTDGDLLESRDSDGRTAADIARLHGQHAAADALVLAKEARSIRTRKERANAAAQRKAMLHRRNSKHTLRLSANFDASEARRISRISRASFGRESGESASTALGRLSTSLSRMSGAIAAGLIASTFTV